MVQISVDIALGCLHHLIHSIYTKGHRDVSPLECEIIVGLLGHFRSGGGFFPKFVLKAFGDTMLRLAAKLKCKDIPKSFSC